MRKLSSAIISAPLISAAEPFRGITAATKSDGALRPPPSQPPPGLKIKAPNIVVDGAARPSAFGTATVAHNVHRLRVN